MIGISHVSTTVSLKLKSLFLNLLLRFSLYMSAHFFFRTTYQLQLSALGQQGSLQKISPEKPFIILHSRGDKPIYSSSQKGHRLTSKFILLDLSPSRMNRKENDTKSGICADLKDPREKLQSVGACPTLELCCASRWGFQLLCFISEIT